MDRRNKISIIIPTLNEEASLEGLLVQLAQFATEVPHELIVVDGKSTDRTEEIAQRYCDQVLITDPGRGRQLNRGASVASGEILWFLHADSRVDRECIPKLLQKVSEGARGGCFSMQFMDPRPVYRVIAWGSNFRAKWLKSFYGDQGIFVEREVFLGLGGFREIPIMEDLDFSRRLKKAVPVSRVEATLDTSPRRFQKGVFRTLLLMQVLKLAFLLKVNPHVLARVYGAGKGSSNLYST